MNEVKQVIDKNPSVPNFWEDISQKTKTEIIDLLVSHLGQPKNDLENNCLNSLARKVVSFFSEKKDTRGEDISSLIGQVAEITQKK